LVRMNASKSTCEELMNKSIKLQDRAKRRNVGEEYNLTNTLRRLTVQQRVSERAIDSDIRLVIDKQRKLGYRTFSLPEDMELSKTESLKHRVMKAARLDHDRPVPVGVAMRNWAEKSKKRANSEATQKFHTMEDITNIAESVESGDSGIVCDKQQQVNLHNHKVPVHHQDHKLHQKLLHQLQDQLYHQLHHLLHFQLHDQLHYQLHYQLHHQLHHQLHYQLHYQLKSFQSIPVTPLRRQQSMEALNVMVAVDEDNKTFIKRISPTPSR